MKYYKNVGCYKEEFRPGGYRPWFFHLQYHPLISPSLSTCLLHCVGHKFAYAALDKDHCGCANEVGDLVKNKTSASACSFNCTMRPFKNVPCGAKLHQSVYEIQHSSILHVYVGCFNVHPLDASMDWKPLSENSPFSHDNKQLDAGKATHCIKHCSKSGFKYAAIYKGLKCGCDHVIKRKTNKISNMYCTYPCLDFKLGTCGSQRGHVISIYLSDEFGMKWMRKAIDTDFLKKELNIQDETDDDDNASNRKSAKKKKKNGTNDNADEEEENKKGKTSGGVNVGVAVGVSVAVVLVIGGVGGFCWWKKKQKSGDNDDEDEEDDDDGDDDDEEKQKKKKKKDKKKGEAKVSNIKKSKNISTKNVKVPDLKYKKEPDPPAKKKKKKSYRSSPSKSSKKESDDSKKPLLD